MIRVFKIITRPEVIVLIVICAVIVVYLYESPSYRGVTLVKDLEVWQPDGAMAFDESWFDESCKVVVYTKSYKRMHFLDLWMDKIEKHPSIPFLFYYAGNDPGKYFDKLDSIGFKHPVMIDSEGQFYKANSGMMDDYNFIAYISK